MDLYPELDMVMWKRMEQPDRQYTDSARIWIGVPSRYRYAPKQIIALQFYGALLFYGMLVGPHQLKGWVPVGLPLILIGIGK
jgi:hypothetical protein